MLKEIKQIVENWINDLNDPNGYWLQQYDDAISCNLADCIAYDSEHIRDLISDYFPDLISEDYDQFVTYMIEYGNWSAIASHSYQTPPGFCVHFGYEGEQYTQIDGVEKYKKSIETLCDVTICDDGVYYYTGNTIFFRLNDPDELWDDFKQWINDRDERIIRLLSDSRGVYIPRDAMDILIDQWFIGFDKEALMRDLLDPTNENYWEAWIWFTDNASYTDENGDSWSLWQDGDLYAIKSSYYHGTI